MHAKLKKSNVSPSRQIISVLSSSWNFTTAPAEPPFSNHCLYQTNQLFYLASTTGQLFPWILVIMTQTNWSQFFQRVCKALLIIPQKFHTLGEATNSLNEISQPKKPLNAPVSRSLPTTLMYTCRLRLRPFCSCL